MNKRMLGAMMLAVLSSGAAYASSQFRSPVSLEYELRGFLHYPLEQVHNAWWYDQAGCPEADKSESPWIIAPWTGAYTRNACDAFWNECDPCHNKVTRKTASIATLIFGQEAFTAENIFSGGTLPCNVTSPEAFNNPFLRFARITPAFSYNESGVVWGINAERRMGCDDKWRVGGRLSIPFKKIEIEQHNFDTDLQEGINDVAVERVFNVDEDADAGTIDYAYRLDFLSCLFRPATPISDSLPLMTFGDGTTGANGQTSIAGTNVSIANSAAQDDSAGVPAIYLVKSSDSTAPIPNPYFGKNSSQVAGNLPADGAGVNAATYFFQDNVNYAASLANDRAAQSTLFVVPHLIDGDTDLAQDAIGIYNAVHQLLNTLGQENSVVEFFKERGIDLAQHECILGLGDLRFDIYGGYGDDFCWYADLDFGVLFPTGKKNKDPKNVYFQSTGNNRHYEVRVGAEGGWRPYEWFGFKADVYYNHAIRRTEKVAAAFKGATVKNIGPTVDASVSWGYVVFHLDFDFRHPKNPDLGCTFGYELFAKQKDSVCFCQATATDFLGRTNQPLDPSVLERNTKVLTNKLRMELYHRWNFGEIFAGGSQIVSGKNAMKETEIHLGFAMYF
jgi:hypothetical protein